MRERWSPEVEIDEGHVLPRKRRRDREVSERGRLALLRERAREHDHLGRLADGRELEVHPQPAVGVGAMAGGLGDHRELAVALELTRWRRARGRAAAASALLPI